MSVVSYPPTSKVWELTRRKLVPHGGLRWRDYHDNEERKPHPRTRYSRMHTLGSRVYLTPAENKAHYMKMMDKWRAEHRGVISRPKKRVKNLRFTQPSKWKYRYRRGALSIEQTHGEHEQQQIQDVKEFGMNALDAHMIPDLASIVMEYVGGPREDKGICVNCNIRKRVCPGFDGNEHYSKATCDFGHCGCSGQHWLPHMTSTANYFGSYQWHDSVTLFEDCVPLTQPHLQIAVAEAAAAAAAAAPATDTAPASN